VSARRIARLALAAVVAGLAPGLAQAHALTGGGGWTDELVCLVPTAIMLVLVFVLSRPTKYGNAERKDEKK
jgi:hypothetical protein